MRALVCASKIRVGAVATLALVGVATTARADPRLRGVAGNVIAAGNSHALLIARGLSTSGYVWGTNASGELGTGKASSSATESPVLMQIVAPRTVSAGTSFSLAIDVKGVLWGWGKTDKCQTGLACSTTGIAKPTPVGSGTTWKSISAGTNHACGITAAGALSCWGDNSQAELGTSARGASAVTPNNISSTIPWMAVSAGDVFTVALKADGSAWSWGYNNHGQLGIASAASYVPGPQPIMAGTRWVAIAAGSAHVLAIKDDGTLWTWGADDDGQLGVGSTQDHSAPVPVTSPSGATASWVSVSAGNKHSLAINSNGTLWAWGDNISGQLGCGSCSSPQKSPVQAGSGGYQYVAAGYDFSLGITADGNLWSWGHNNDGQLANGLTANGAVPARVPDDSSGTFAAIKPAMLVGGAGNTEGINGGFNGARIKTSGVLEVWGNDNPVAPDAPNTLGLGGVLHNGRTQLAQAQVDGVCDSTPTCWAPLPVALTKPFIQAALGQGETVAIASDGTLWTWGASITTPTQVGSSTWVKVFADQFSGRGAYAIRGDGTLWSLAGTGTPKQVCGASTPCSAKRWATGVASGTTLGVATDGSLWTFNSTNGPEPLDGSTSDSPPAWSGKTWQDVEVGAADTSAIDSGGNLWTWGYGNYGQLGRGVVNGSGTGVPVSSQSIVLTNAISAVTCLTDVMAMDASGRAWVWGENSTGELGVSGGEVDYVTDAFLGTQLNGGNSDTKPDWTDAGLSSPVTALACGAVTSFIEDAWGAEWASGDNGGGEMGGGGITGSSSLPVYTGTGLVYPGRIVPLGYNASVNPSTAGNVNDGGTWTTGAPQKSGQWFEISLEGPQYVSGLALDSGSAKTFPAAYTVSVSIDGSTWYPVTAGTGYGEGMTITFPVQWAQYIQITQTGSSSSAWNITGIVAIY